GGAEVEVGRHDGTRGVDAVVELRGGRILGVSGLDGQDGELCLAIGQRTRHQLLLLFPGGRGEWGDVTGYGGLPFSPPFARLACALAGSQGEVPRDRWHRHEVFGDAMLDAAALGVHVDELLGHGSSVGAREVTTTPTPAPTRLVRKRGDTGRPRDTGGGSRSAAARPGRAVQPAHPRAAARGPPDR